ncbi:MAG TPA: hypothetical protein VH062_27050 [Polyangiaceae bacterium]|jgi:hypothetical protein|nr:hypothetical protein [Polyangiaceae bacterium]
MTTAYDRWAELAERDSLGEALTADERGFLEEYAANDPVAAAELELFESLSLFDDADDEAADTALAARAVASALMAEKAAERIAPVTPLRRGRWLVWGIGSAAAAAAAFAVFARSPAVVAPVAIGGSVIEYVAAAVQVGGQRVDKGAHAAVGSDVAAVGGAACVAVEPHIHACLADGAHVRLTAVGNGKRRLDLLAGRVAVALDPLPPNERLSVVANGVWSTAVGTAFTVELLADGSVRTVVHEGKVAVGAEGSTDIVNGHKIGLTTGGTVVVDPPVPHAGLETADWVALAQVAGRPIEGPTAEVAFAPVAPAAEGAVAQEPVAEAKAAHVAHVADGHKAAPEPVAAVAAAPDVTAASLLAAARQALREQRWSDASTAYRQLVDGFSATPEAHTVLVPLAKLELDRLGQPAVALRDLNTYLDRGGPLVLEAKLARVKAYRLLGRASDEAAAIDDVLASHPSGLEAEQLRQRRSELGL